MKVTVSKQRMMIETLCEAGDVELVKRSVMTVIQEPIMKTCFSK